VNPGRIQKDRKNDFLFKKMIFLPIAILSSTGSIISSYKKIQVLANLRCIKSGNLFFGNNKKNLIQTETLFG
jgi:hypothetical protein